MNVVKWIVFEVPIIFHIVHIELHIWSHTGERRVRQKGCIRMLERIILIRLDRTEVVCFYLELKLVKS